MTLPYIPLYRNCGAVVTFLPLRYNMKCATFVPTTGEGSDRGQIWIRQAYTYQFGRMAWALAQPSACGVWHAVARRTVAWVAHVDLDF